MARIGPGLAASCFSPTYAAARARFLQAAEKAGARIDIHLNPVATAPDGGSLTTDVAILGPDDAETGFLIISGTHGPEGFVGSAAQVALLEEMANGAIRPAHRLVLIHAINPWGFAHVIRTTEHHVDLNRNFVDWGRGPIANDRYPELHPLLCPTDYSDAGLKQADAARQAWIQANGIDAYFDVMAKGQYTRPDGVHYGGKGPEWSHGTLKAIVEGRLGRVRRLAVIDWHTGLGEPGQPFFLCFNAPGSAGWERACGWWGRDRVETQAGFDGAKRPAYQGLVFYGVQAFAPQADVTGAVIEFGTRSPDEMRKAMAIEHRLKFGGPIDEAERQALHADFREAFSPSSPVWQQSTLNHAIAIQHQTLAGLGDWQGRDDRPQQDRAHNARHG